LRTLDRIEPLSQLTCSSGARGRAGPVRVDAEGGDGSAGSELVGANGNGGDGLVAYVMLSTPFIPEDASPPGLFAVLRYS
jgi:hypothetical protein